MNIRKYVILQLIILVGVLMYSCSNDEILPEPDNENKEISFSVFLNGPQKVNVRSSGNVDTNAESKIYSLEVLVFRSAGETKEGELDGYGYIARKEQSVSGQNYDKEYAEINEIKEIKMTAGKRDIYVVANAPDKYFDGVQNIQEFLKKHENLSTQGRYPHPGTTTDPDDDLPIGGLNPSNWKTNLTMCNYMKDVTFSKTHARHYLGYTTNGGLPEGVTSGKPLDGVNPFLVERLVARVAIQKIDFDLPASLEFETGYPCSNYSYQIDSVFMMNVKTTSKFESGSQLGFIEKVGHGSKRAYEFLSAPSRLADLYAQGEYPDFLYEAITSPNYDIEKNATPLWFYAFENEGTNPTYLIIGARYNFKSPKDGQIKTVKSYYPIKVNREDGNKTADHDYIKRNYQYFITAKIKGLGAMYGHDPVLLKSTQLNESEDIEVSETVGRNLFPWVGDTYR